MGVEVRTGVKVTNIDGHGVHIGDELIKCHTVLWCAGIAPSPLATRVKGASLDKTGRILVQEDLSIEGFREAFAIGDIATFLHQGGKPLPGLAPVAMQQGRHAAGCILNDLAGEPRRKFIYSDRGSLATIGRSAAVADFGNMKLSGFWAWLAWLFVHVMFLIGFRNRIVVMLDWILSYLTYQRGSRLITGHRMEAGAPGKRLTKQIMKLDVSERLKVVEELRQTLSGAEAESKE
jgi:NADH dehydrogenase